MFILDRKISSTILDGVYLVLENVNDSLSTRVVSKVIQIPRTLRKKHRPRSGKILIEVQSVLEGVESLQTSPFRLSLQLRWRYVDKVDVGGILESLCTAKNLILNI